MPAAAVAKGAPKPAPAVATYSIGELAREFDLTTRAIRFYEDCGLLTPRRSGRNRVYSQRDRTRLKLTLRGKRLGLTLSEIRELIDMYEPGRDERPQLKRFLADFSYGRNSEELKFVEAGVVHAAVDVLHTHGPGVGAVGLP